MYIIISSINSYINTTTCYLDCLDDLTKKMTYYCSSLGGLNFAYFFLNNCFRNHGLLPQRYLSNTSTLVVYIKLTTLPCIRITGGPDDNKYCTFRDWANGRPVMYVN